MQSDVAVFHDFYIICWMVKPAQKATNVRGIRFAGPKSLDSRDAGTTRPELRDRKKARKTSLK